MSIQGHIYSRLSGYAGLTALVGLRIYPVSAPEDPEYPLVVFTKISNPKILAGGGSSGNLNDARYQISCWANTYDQARAIADQVVGALEDYSGTADTTVVDSSLYDGETEFGIEPETKKYHIAIDFIIAHF